MSRWITGSDIGLPISRKTSKNNIMGDVAGFTSLRILPEACEENPPLLNGLQNTCLLNTKIPRDICSGVPCFLNRHMSYNRPSIRNPRFPASRTYQLRFKAQFPSHNFNQFLYGPLGQVFLFKKRLRLFEGLTYKIPAPQNSVVVENSCVLFFQP